MCAWQAQSSQRAKRGQRMGLPFYLPAKSQQSHDCEKQAQGSRFQTTGQGLDSAQRLKAMRVDLMHVLAARVGEKLGPTTQPAPDRLTKHYPSRCMHYDIMALLQLYSCLITIYSRNQFACGQCGNCSCAPLCLPLPRQINQSKQSQALYSVSFHHCVATACDG